MARVVGAGGGDVGAVGGSDGGGMKDEVHDHVSVAPPLGLTDAWGTVSCVGVLLLIGRACIVSMTVILGFFFRVARLCSL